MYDFWSKSTQLWKSSGLVTKLSELHCSETSFDRDYVIYFIFIIEYFFSSKPKIFFTIFTSEPRSFFPSVSITKVISVVFNSIDIFFTPGIPYFTNGVSNLPRKTLENPTNFGLYKLYFQKIYFTIVFSELFIYFCICNK